jgi:4-hydroxy-tetrahydrodipicolinate synthase
MQTSSKKSSKQFEGVYTALVTPFLADSTVDWKSYDSFIDEQLAAKVHGVVPCGTTGESPTLTSDEKAKLIEIAVKKCKGKAFVIAGTGSNDTAATIEASKKACALGVDGLLIVTPYYNKPSQTAMQAHFLAVAEASSVPIILYNVPGRTGVSLSADTVAKLAQHPKIVGIKEASANMALLSEMRVAVAAATSKPFTFLSGDDVTYWPFLACGGDGVISVASNVLPGCMRLLLECWQDSKLDEGLLLHEKLSAFFNVLFIEANPVPIKALLAYENRMTAKTRMPLGEIAPENFEKLKRVWTALPAPIRNDRIAEIFP